MEVLLVLAILLIISLTFANYILHNDTKYVTVSEYNCPFTGNSLLTLINNNSKFLLDGSLVLFDCGNDCLEYGDFPVNQITRYYTITPFTPLYENLSLYSDIIGPSNPTKECNDVQLFELYHPALTIEELKKELRTFPDKKIYFRCKDDGSIGLNYVTDIDVEKDKLILKSI